MEFWKQYCVASLNAAFVSGDIKEICQAVLLSGMNEDNRVVLRISITQAIARLTNKTQRSIQKALNELEKLNFGRLEKKNVYVVNGVFACKSQQTATTGFGLPTYSKEFESFLAEFMVLFDSTQMIRRTKKSKDEDMNVVIQTLSKQLEAQNQQIVMLLRLVEKIATGGQVSAEEARRHLTLVKK